MIKDLVSVYAYLNCIASQGLDLSGLRGEKVSCAGFYVNGVLISAFGVSN